MSIVAVAGSTFTYYLPGLEDQDNPGLLKAAPTIAAADFTISTNGGGFEAMDNTPTVKPTGGKQIEFVLSAAETTAAGDGGTIVIECSDASGAEWFDVAINVPVRAADLSVLGGTAQTGDAYAIVNHTDYGNAKLVRATTPANTLDVNATGEAGIDWANVGGKTSTVALTGTSLNSVSGSIGGDVAGKVLGGGVSVITGTGVQIAVDAQDISDALKLAPSAGSYAVNSVYERVGNLLGNSASQLETDAWTSLSSDLKSLYDDNAIDVSTGLPSAWDAGGASNFAAWTICEFDGSLFVGISNQPMNGTGGIIGRMDTPGTALEFEYNLHEEGVMVMAVNPAGTALWVVGVDTRNNADNCSIYKRDTAGTWTRRATILNFVDVGLQHVCDITFVGSRIYICGQGYKSVAWSDDDGVTWTYSTPMVVGRAYSMIALANGDLIMSGTNDFFAYSVFRSVDDGVSWTQIVSYIETVSNQFVLFGGLAVCGVGYSKVISIDEIGGITDFPLPFDLRVTHNNLVVLDDGYLYALGSTGVWRTGDLVSWFPVWNLTALAGATIKTIGTWGNQLVVSSSGELAALRGRLASPEATQQQMIADATLTQLSRELIRCANCFGCFSSVLVAKASGGGTNTLVFRDVDNSKNRVTITVDAHGNRSSVVLDED